MTNRAMVTGPAEDDNGQRPNTKPLPPMPAAEDSPTPTTDREPIDSPQPNASVERAAPDAQRQGLATKR
ncbi:hypothetical protein MPOCJGCO_2131 [Methylobacterium trifolii]|uniref:Uncharacterized protein n=2 Tax=Methylobacterium trifolii TaxID=1003092 RepID=A0ABQ4U112_9HYPH|nr:hypothetical protein MPOCJGCO_2131 [Methylobacterium trifolii]